jgi:hypothetical protein
MNEKSKLAVAVAAVAAVAATLPPHQLQLLTKLALLFTLKMATQCSVLFCHLQKETTKNS